jgi:hypothetical protein
VTKRDYELGPLDLPDHIRISELDGLSRISRHGPRLARLLDAPKERKTLREIRPRKDHFAKKLIPGMTMVGYFQSPAYFETIEEELFSLLTKSLNKSISANGTGEGNKDNTNIHVRRGDYLQSQNSAFHGLTSLNYFREGVSRVQKTNGVGRVRIYSDSPEYVAEEFLGSDFDYEIESPLDDFGAFETLAALSRGENLIMSNSSLSWWAGWLLTRTSPGASVIAPKPWTLGDTQAADFFLPTWVNIDARF